MTLPLDTHIQTFLRITWAALICALSMYSMCMKRGVLASLLMYCFFTCAPALMCLFMRGIEVILFPHTASLNV